MPGAGEIIGGSPVGQRCPARDDVAVAVLFLGELADLPLEAKVTDLNAVAKGREGGRGGGGGCTPMRWAVDIGADMTLISSRG